MTGPILTVRPARHQRGDTAVSYAAITALMMGALLVPFGNANKSAIVRLMDAIKREHSQYLYAASAPALPHGEGWLSNLADTPVTGSSGSGTASGDGSGGGGTIEGPSSQGGGDVPGGQGTGAGGGSAGDPIGAGPGDTGGSGNPPAETPIAEAPNDPAADPGNTPGNPNGPEDTVAEGGGPGNGQPNSCPVEEPGPAFGPDEPNNFFAGATPTGAATPMRIAATHVGNPIHVATGNKYQQAIDMPALPGAHGIAFIRHYNSRSPYVGHLGANWRHNFRVVIKERRSDLEKRGDAIALWQADGRRIDFLYHHSAHGSDFYHAATHADGTLTSGPEGTLWYWRNGAVLWFDQSAKLQTISHPDGSETRLAYDGRGRLKQITDPQGRSLKLHYQGQRLAAVQTPGGPRIRYTYGANGNLTKVTYPDSTAKRYHYQDPHDAHNLTGISLKGTGNRAQGTADTQGQATTAEGSERLTPHVSRLTRIATWAYDNQDRAVLSMHANGADKVTLDFQDHHTVVTDAAGRVSIYQTKRIRGVPVVTAIHGPGCNPCGNGNVAYAYNDALQIKTVTAANGAAKVFTYDALGRLQRAAWRSGQGPKQGQEQLIARFDYLKDSDLVTRIASPSVNPNALRVIEIRYDGRRRPVTLIQTGYAPTPAGDYRKISRRRVIDYGARGHIVRVSGWQEHPEDAVARRVAANGSTNESTSASINVSTTADPASGIRFERGRGGVLSAIHLPTGATHRILARNVQGRPTRIAIEDLPALTIDYDPRGRITALGMAHRQRKLRYAYAPDGRLTALGIGQNVGQNSGGKTQQAPQNARPAKHAARQASPKTSAAATRAAQASAVAAAPRIAPIAAIPARLSRGRVTATNNLGQPIAVTDPAGHTTRIGYDDFGNRVFIDSPDAGLSQSRYDAAGNVIATTDAAGHSAKFRYDAANRLIAAKLPHSLTRYGYRQVKPNTPAKLVAIDGAAKEIRRYDDQGRLIQRSRAIGEAVYATRYHYDENGRLLSHTLPSGKTLRYAYQDGALSGIALAAGPLPTVWPATPILSGLNDEPPGALLHDVIHGNGIQTVRQIQHNKLTGLSVGGLYDLRYAYGPKGRITAIDRKTYPSGKTHPLRRYRYDTHGRLDFAITPWALYGYRYGPNGNRTHTVINGREGIYAYRPNNNRLAALTKQAPTWHTPLKAKPLRVAALPHLLAAPPMRTTTAVNYSANGQRLALNGLRLKYNANGQVKAVYAGDTRIASYTYDSRARRIAKTVYGAQSTETEKPKTTHYLYQGNRLIAEADVQGNIQREYVYHRGKPIAVLQGETIYAVHTNHLGAPIAVTNQQRELVWQAAYAPFGRAFVNDDPDHNGKAFVLNLRLPGQYEDQETGLYYNHHRTYNPDTGRYLSPDPLGLAAGPNPYVYAANDPVNYIDPTGLLLFAFDGTDNSDRKPLDRQTNVYQFREAYKGDTTSEPITHLSTVHGPHWYYITGAGRDDRRSGLTKNATDIADGNLTGERVLIMAQYFYGYLNKLRRLNEANVLYTDELNIDIVGFSRGASEARIFANLLDRFLDLGGDDEFMVTDGVFSNDTADFTQPVAAMAREFLRRTQGCFQVNLRFLGLWDTVPHIGGVEFNDSKESYSDNFGDAYLAIPDRVQFAAHAVAVNERREVFDSWSIYERPGQSKAGRIEKGFVGAHADIGGGYADSDIADIAFMWMVNQARRAGIPTGPGEVLDTDVFVRDESGVPRENQWNEVTRPRVHDQLFDAPVPIDGVYLPERDFRYLDPGDDTDVRQIDYRVPDGAKDLDFVTALDFIEGNIYTDTRFSSDGPDSQSTMLSTNDHGEYPYQRWLAENYSLHIDISNEPGRAGPDQ